MKEDILKYFKEDRSYESGIRLYMKYGNHIGFKKQLNIQPKSQHLLNMLHEELRAVAFITPFELKEILLSPIFLPKNDEEEKNFPDPQKQVPEHQEPILLFTKNQKKKMKKTVKK